MGKGNRLPGSLGSSREFQRIWVQRGTHQGTSSLPKIKDKERILKAVRGKERVTYKGVPIRLSADFSKETLQARRDWQKYSSDEKQGPTT